MSSTSWRRGITVAVGTITMALAAATPQASARPAPPSPPIPPVPQLPALLRNVQFASSLPSAEDSGFTKTATVTCPANTVVVGTGVSMVNNDDQVLVTSIIPTETTVSVSAYEDETGHSGDWSVTAMATCATRPDGYQIIRRAGLQSNINPRSQAATCAAGTQPLGLGWSVAGSYGQLTVTEARAVPGPSRTVTISASEDDTGVTPQWNVEAIAICANVIGLEVVSETDPAARTYEIDHAYCPTGKVAIGAGFTFNDDPNVLISHMYPYFGSDYSYVIAREDEDGAPAAWTFTVDAMCAPLMPVIPA